ncbi:MAG: response regulator [Pseudomonadota bacterium]
MLSKHSVLIVDDTPANLALAVDMLERQGLRLSVAQGGAEALRRVALAPPDLILLDVMLPDMDGFEVCRRLKAGSAAVARVPVIFMTALSGTADKVAGFGAGAVDYLTKPLQVEEVLARVATHLRLADMQARLERQNAMLEQQNALLAQENQERRAAQWVLQHYRDSLEQQVVERTAQLRELGAHRESVREDERKRIARELHDELGQSLTALRMTAALLRVRFGAQLPELNAHVRGMTELVDRTIGVVRNVATSLRPAVLDMGIGSALEWLAEEFRRHGTAACRLTLDLRRQELSEQQAVTVFRIVQESLTNVARHAAASGVTVALRCRGRTCTLEVSDDGRGFDPAAARPHSFGLLGIRERVLTLGGRLQVDSTPGGGTRLAVSFPLKQQDSA